MIDNPVHQNYCGIIESPPVPTPVLAGQTWRAEIYVRAALPELLYMTINFLDKTGDLILTKTEKFAVNNRMQSYSLLYTIPAGAHQALLEIGFFASNTLWIDQICKYRKIPEPTKDSHYSRMYIASAECRRAAKTVCIGRESVCLDARSIEKITFIPERESIIFFEFHLSCSGSLTIEATLQKPKIKLTSDCAELSIQLIQPLKVVSGGYPLIIHACNYSDSPLSYAITLVGSIY